MAKIFLCHASEDKTRVREVYRRLREEGFQPWLDEEDLVGGQLWEREIPIALQASDFILIFFSQNSIRKIGYVQNEFKLALETWRQIPEGMIHAIPVRLDTCEIPGEFRRFQWIDLFDESGFERILRAIRAGLSQRPVNQTPLEGLSAIRNQMLKANSVWELREALYSTERLLETEPNYPEARLLKGQIDQAILYELARIAREAHVPLFSLQTITNSINMEFVLISAGTFLMGTADGGEWERPEHPVRINHPFYLGKYPVTQAQWATVMGNNPSMFKGHPDWPVENVSWEDVHVFIQTLKAREGEEDYRLPTEAEWEYACRAGSTASYCFGDDPNQLGEYAWYRENAGGQPHPVGLLKPNAWGLYDMHGNVWEWVQDWYRPYPTDL